MFLATSTRDLVEPPGGVPLRVRRSGGRGEHEAARCARELLPLDERSVRTREQRTSANRAALGRSRDASAHREPRRVQVDILPTEREELAAAHARVDHERDQQPIAILEDTRRREVADLFEGEVRPRILDVADRWDLGVRSGVPLHELACAGVVEALAEQPQRMLDRLRRQIPTRRHQPSAGLRSDRAGRLRSSELRDPVLHVCRAHRLERPVDELGELHALPVGAFLPDGPDLTPELAAVQPLRAPRAHRDRAGLQDGA